MAVIRCPHCGKPNPDFIDACQYCEQPLRAPDEAAGAAASEGTIRKSLIQRCPNCGKPNPDFLDRCQFCDTPLKAGAPAPAAAPAPETGPQAEPAADLPDWLRALRDESAEATAPAPAAEPAADVPDWLKGATGPFAGAEPPTESPTEPASTDDVPDWLRGAGAAPASADEAPDWMKGSGMLAPQPKTGEVPDWLKGTGALPVPAAPEASPPDWLKGGSAVLGAAGAAFVEPPESGEAPDWMRDLAGEAGTPASPALSADAPLPAILPGPEDEPDFLNNLRGAATPVVEEEAPDWLKSLGLSEAAEPAASTPALDFSAPAPAGQDQEEPEWMRTLRADAAPAAPAAPAETGPEPDWLTALRAESPAAGEAGPAVTSPFSFEMEEPAPGPAAPAGGEPDWLAALRPSAPAEMPAAEPVEGLELAQGALPAWLAAMRPVEVERAIEPEVDDYEEKVGVLSGMRGILRAEPGVVLPGKSAANVHTLVYTEAQASQAEALAAMLLSDKEAGASAGRKTRVSVPWERWLVTVLLLVGLLAPPVLLPSLFVQPTRAAPETLAAFDAVERLPVDRPVLVAFDYEPAQGGELRPLAEAVVGHLVRRGVPLVAVSTSLAGAGVAQEALEALTAQNAYSPTVTHVNLGYLPGGPIGILQFSLDSRASFAVDFSGARYEAQGGLWQLPVLRPVATLDDFGAVVVLSAVPEAARAWIEQTQGRPTPLLLAVGAGVAPLVRPYYEADPSRVAGLVSGVMGAAQYQARAGQPVSVETDFFWQMLGGGLWTSALLLILGNLAHGALQALRRSRKRKA